MSEDDTEQSTCGDPWFPPGTAGGSTSGGGVSCQTAAPLRSVAEADERSPSPTGCGGREADAAGMGEGGGSDWHSPPRQRPGAQKRTEELHHRPKDQRKPTWRWDEYEVDVLLKGVREYGVGNWVKILQWGKDYGAFVEGDRKSVDLKDKWRNLAKAGRCAEDQGGHLHKNRGRSAEDQGVRRPKAGRGAPDL